MLKTYVSAMIFAGLMIIFAVLARVGLADRDTVQIVLLALPLVAFLQITGHGARCSRVSSEA